MASSRLSCCLFFFIALCWCIQLKCQAFTRNHVQLHQFGIPASKARPTTIIQATRNATETATSASKTVSLPVYAYGRKTSREVPFPITSVELLEDAAKTVRQTSSNFPGISLLVIPSWRQHPLHFDPLLAASDIAGVDAKLCKLSDAQWAAALGGLREAHRRLAAGRPGVQASVIRALGPAFVALNALLAEGQAAASAGAEEGEEGAAEEEGGAPRRRRRRRRLAIVACDDAAWLLQAFLFTQKPDDAKDDSQIQALVLLGATYQSDAGRLALAYMDAAAAGEELAAKLPLLAFRGAAATALPDHHQQREDKEAVAAPQLLCLTAAEEGPDGGGPPDHYPATAQGLLRSSCLISGLDARSCSINEGLLKPAAVALWLNQICRFLVENDDVDDIVRE